MNTPTMRFRATRPRRRRGSAYVMILATAMLATMIGLSSLLVARIQRRASELTGSVTEARFHAISAVDRGLHIIETSPSSWRAQLAGTTLMDRPIGRGRYTLQASDPIDGDLEVGADPVVLTGIGAAGDAIFKVEVQLDGDGKMIGGTWRRVTD